MKRYSFAITLLIFSLFPLSAVENFIMEVESGVTWMHNEAHREKDSKNKDPDPILFRFGVAFPVYISDSFFLRPSLTMMVNSWEFRAENNWAMPVDPMWQDLRVMSLLLDLGVGYQWHFKSFGLAFFAGPACNLRIPLGGEDGSVRDDMASYFYKDGQFFNISTGFFFFIPLSEFIGLTLKGDSWIPIANLWSDRELSFSNGLMISLSAGFRFTL